MTRLLHPRRERPVEPLTDEQIAAEALGYATPAPRPERRCSWRRSLLLGLIGLTHDPRKDHR